MAGDTSMPWEKCKAVYYQRGNLCCITTPFILPVKVTGHVSWKPHFYVSHSETPMMQILVKFCCSALVCSEKTKAKDKFGKKFNEVV